MSKSKQIFRLYPLMLDKTVKTMRKHAPKGMKKQPETMLIREFFRLAPEQRNTLAFPTMAEEWKWKTNTGSRGAIVVPEDERMLHLLNRAKFELETARPLRFPSDAFMLALPTGFELDGYPIPPALVHWRPLADVSPDVYEPFGEALGMPMGRGTPRLREGLDPELPSLSITYQDPEDKRGVGRLVVHCDDIPRIMSAQSASEILEVVGNFEATKFEGVLKPTDIGLNVQARLLKLIISLGVYYTATEEGESLEPGMPSPEARFSQPKAPQWRPFTLRSLANRYRAEASDGHQSVDDVEGEITEHSRSWHFRQLRAERFYQGQYASLPRGSRIVFVSDALVTRRRKRHAGESHSS